MFNRSSGVLMHISSLPGKYGVGNLGAAARDFADRLSEMGFSAWQILPVGPTDAFNSPYASLSAFAGNPAFIDPEQLFEAGLLTAEELKACEVDSPYRADYAAVDKWLMPTLRRAFSRADDELMKKVRSFAKKSHWLPDYALFRAIKAQDPDTPWDKWEPGLKLREKSALAKAKKELAEDIDFYCFVQYQFYTQWAELKKYVNSKGISLIGDMPIYLSLDSADIWAEPGLFDLDEDLCQKSCAGVPPDYFSEEGQRWGNPLYNWEAMKADGYGWWIRRIENSLRLYDAVRIDHFRGFSSYWEVPAGKSAKFGRWRKGPGMDLFGALNKAHPGAAIIAEDLGDIDDDVRRLVRDSGFPGMAVLQFAFIETGDNVHLPHNHTKNTVAYTGTHDNDTLMGWLWSDDQNRQYALDYCGFEGDWGQGGPKSPVIRSMVRTLWRSGAILTILPIQDLCGFGGDCRMNLPGVADGNWSFRVTKEALNQIDARWIRGMNELYRRNNALLR